MYDEEMKGTVVDIIRAREKQHTASCRKISRTIKKKNRKQPAPCAKTVNDAAIGPLSMACRPRVGYPSPMAVVWVS